MTPRASQPRTTALALIGFIGLCLLVGATDATLVRHSLPGWYLSLARPPGTPPAWIFGSAWTALSIMTGTAAWLVWRRVGAGPALQLWGWQIAAGALWAPAFFGLHQVVLALAVVLVLLALAVGTLRAFAGLSSPAAWLMVPYLAWSAYAAYLGFGFWWLNRV